MSRRGRQLVLTAALLVGSLAALASPATAADPSRTGRIGPQDERKGTLLMTFEGTALAENAMIDTSSVHVTFEGEQLTGAEAKAVATDVAATRRVILAFDNSQSMLSHLPQAKAAAKLFLDNAPPSIEVGLVTFGKSATLDVQPTLNHAEVISKVDALTIDDTVGTALYDATITAVEAAASATGSHYVLMLTDGKNKNSTAVRERAVTAVKNSGGPFDAVYIGNDPTAPDDLSVLVGAEPGNRLLDIDPSELEARFAEAGRAISSQVQITVPVPARLSGRSGNVEVSARAGGQLISDSVYIVFDKGRISAAQRFGPQKVTPGSPLVTDSLLPVAIGAVFLGLLVLLTLGFTTAGVTDRQQGRVRRRLSLYTVAGRQATAREQTTTALGSSQVARSAVELAGRVVEKRDFEGELGRRLEASGVPLRAAEWMLIHIGVALGLSILLLLVSGGAILPTAVGLLLGLMAPWLYLSFKESRRTSAFLSQLPDTLQLVAGSLSAGYAMAQAIDTVVREGQQPITGEFNRALIEARLGVPIEDALEGVATRMQSKDFAWVVMAIRIQREVGGNLAELLTTVAGTMRERERLRRQVQVLSAEGRLSAWILGLLPPAFSLYLLLVRPVYLKPLVSDPLGWLILSVGVVLLTVGALWMRKAVKVEV